MKIKATYKHEDLAYIVQVDEQTLTIPDEFMSRFVSNVETAYYRQKHARVQAARKAVEEAHHPDVLPFTQDKPPCKPPGRPPKTHSISRKTANETEAQKAEASSE